MDKQDMLQNFVDSKKEHLSSKQEIIAHFRAEHGDKYRPYAAAAIAGTSDKKSREYRSAIRDFQGKREGQAGKPGRYEAIGQKLPPVFKSDKITVTVKGTQARDKGDGGGTRSKSITATFEGQKAKDFVANPNYDEIYDDYEVDPDTFNDGDYELEVNSVS
jgi:hypothetical protein